MHKKKLLSENNSLLYLLYYEKYMLYTFKTAYSQILNPSFFKTYPKPSWLSPRPISNSQLHALLHFHLCPIYLVVFKGSYNLRWDISS